ncbi:MAG: FG-GAP repeat domain-containing protein [Chloroflexota bacterium]
MKNRNSSATVIILVIVLVGCSGPVSVTEIQPTSLPPNVQPSATIKPAPAATQGICPPYYSEPEVVFTLHPPTDLQHIVSADFNDDGWMDILSVRSHFPTTETYEPDILLNDGNRKLILGTSNIFSGAVPLVTFPRELVLADFNGDGRPDVFFADSGADVPPQPGYQNTLVLSAPGGKMVDATANLPQQSSYSHSAAAADIDADGDIDLYVGNIWSSQTHNLPPQILINEGNASQFTVAKGRLPYPIEDLDFGAFTTSEFVDVNSDGSPDLILGDAGDDLAGGKESLVLLNDGRGYFSKLANAIPQNQFSMTLALDIDATDLNEDGYQDLIINYTKQEYSGRYIQILINNQDGTFRDETSTRLPQSDNNSGWIMWIYLIDLNRDGHLDIIAASLTGANPLFYLNNGDGSFRSLPNVFHINTSLLFTFIDIDRDGFLDVIWTYGGCETGRCPEEYFLLHSLGCPTLD